MKQRLRFEIPADPRIRGIPVVMTFATAREEKKGGQLGFFIVLTAISS
jgi:hypothetical protein